MTLRDLRALWPLGMAVGLAAAWPLVSYATHPAVLPLLLLFAGLVVAIAVRPEVGLVIVLLLAPFTNAALGGGRPIRFAESGLAIAVLVYAGVMGHRRQQGRLPGSLAVAVIAFLCVAAVSSVHAIAPATSLTRFLGLVAATAVFYGVLEICRRPDQLRLIVGGAVGSLLLAGTYGVVQKVTGNTSNAGVVIDDEVVGRVAGTFSHPNQFAGYLVVLMPLAGAVLFTREASPRLRSMAAAALAVSLAALAFSFTRGAIVGIVGGLLIWLAFVRPRTAVLVALAIAVGGVALAPSALKERLSGSTGGDIGLRADLWKSALEIYGEEPVLGVGLGNFGDGYARLPAQSAGTQRRLLHQSQLLVPPHANNLFLTILAEEGIIGALAFLGLMGAALALCLRASRLRDPMGRAVGVGLGAGLCAMLVQSLLDYALFGEMSLPLFALLGVAGVFVARETPVAAARR